MMVTTSRYPVRQALDGDFDLGSVLARFSTVGAEVHPKLRPGMIRALLQAEIWRLPAATPVSTDIEPSTASASQPISEDDLQLLHRFEAAPLWRPPVAAATAGLDPLTAMSWLLLAEHWLAVHDGTRDIRFFNTACKLLGAVCACGNICSQVATWNDPQLVGQIALVAHAIERATQFLFATLSVRQMEPTASGEAVLPSLPAVDTVQRLGRVVLLCGEGSSGARLLMRAAVDDGIPITHVLWYQPEQPGPATARPSAYDSAWYPPARERSISDERPAPPSYPEVHVTGWEQVAANLRQLAPDAVLLVGMPIVPASVLQTASLGFLNAHNGFLPQYRGMDAVAWALLNDDPIACTLHMARTHVDAGDIISSLTVPPLPLPSLKARVKAAQLHLLLSAAQHITATGQLPPTAPQDHGGARLYYRLHPHLKRILDNSPYGQTTGGETMNTALSHPALTRLTGIDWDRPSSILEGCTPLFEAAATEPDLLPSMLQRLPEDEHLAVLCERYDFLDKLVLADLAEQGVRIRLHLYRPGYFDRPHNHRWNFASNIIRGQYRHQIFGSDDTFNEQTDPDSLIPIHERIERAGDYYVLRHTSVHTVQAEADTMSLLVRGPATKDRFLIIDRAVGGFFWVYGQANETREQRDNKTMTAQQLAQSVAYCTYLLAQSRGQAS